MTDATEALLPMPTRTMRHVARELARAFLAGEASPPAQRARGARALGRFWPWLFPLCLGLRFEFASSWNAASHARIASYILAHPAFREAFVNAEEAPQIRARFPYHPLMEALPTALAGIERPSLATPGDLADWLGISPTELDGFTKAPDWNQNSRYPRRQHYYSHWMSKPSGGLRLIEAPKSRLRGIQRRILRGILDRVPAHAAASGSVRGASAVDNAARHAGCSLLLSLDLRDFFPSIPAARVHALFRTLGYPVATARALTGLTTQCTPLAVLNQAPPPEYPSPEEQDRHRQWLRRFRERHLPQGAPTSPALANLCAYRLDLRLAGAALECRANYSRYVDDISFSLDSADMARGRRLLAMLGDIVREEGFIPNWRKARIEGRSGAQRVTGLTVNQHPNLPRPAYDRLRAILSNCRRHGPASQNRAEHPDFKAHLQGQMAWFAQVNPTRGKKLRELFAAIDWE